MAVAGRGLDSWSWLLCESVSWVLLWAGGTGGRAPGDGGVPGEDVEAFLQRQHRQIITTAIREVCYRLLLPSDCVIVAMVTRVLRVAYCV